MVERTSPPATPAATDYLAVRAAAVPDKVALIADLPGQDLRTWTYRELNLAVNRVANALRRQGIRPGSSVLWCGRNSPEVVHFIHAARKCGVTSVPVNYRFSAEEAAYVVDNSDSVFGWIDAEHAELFAAIRPKVPKLESIVVYGGAPAKGMDAAEKWLDGASAEEPPLPGVEGRSMIYTSGTSGKPKGAVRTGQGNPEHLAAMVAYLGYLPDDIYITTGPIYHSGPGGFMGIAFLLGHTVVVQRKFDPEDWLRLVERHRVTSTFSAPTPIRMICHLPEDVKARYDRSSMRIMVANAAPWPFPLKQAYVRDFPPSSLWEVYGSTELGVDMILRPEDQLRKPGSCGKPSPMVEVKLFDDNGEEVTTPRQPGEVFIKSPSLYDTYHKAEDKYRSGIRAGYHTVGDVAYFDEEGYYYICDRKTDMIISGGMNIYPAEVEAALESHPRIYDAAVFGIPSEEWGESVHAVVVLHPGEGLSSEEVIAHCRAHLAGYKIPRSVSFLPELPRTGSGKILKRLLREPYWKGRERSV